MDAVKGIFEKICDTLKWDASNLNKMFDDLRQRDYRIAHQFIQFITYKGQALCESL